MMKKTAGLLSLCLILCLVTAGRASAETGLGSTSAEMTNTADDQTSGAEETQRLGSITDKTAYEMKELLGNGDVAITISEE